MERNLQLVSNSNFEEGMGTPAIAPNSDQKLLDAYSEAVISVVDKVSPAVVIYRCSTAIKKQKEK